MARAENRHVSIALTSIAFLFLFASSIYALHTFEFGWVIGKMVVPYDGKHIFKSTGFVFRYGGHTYVITTFHTLEGVRKEFGQNAPIMFSPPMLDEPLPARLIFTEPSEDSAVFEIKELPPGYEFDTVYESPLSLSDEETVAIYGYTEAESRKHEPESLKVDFITKATLNFMTDSLSLPPHLNESDSSVILTKCEAPLYGMSGSPALRPVSRTLVGMVKSFGSTRNDDRLSSRLGAVKFHIIVRLDRTIERIKEISSLQ